MVIARWMLAVIMMIIISLSYVPELYCGVLSRKWVAKNVSR